MNFTSWLAEQAAMRTDEVADFAQGPVCHARWPVDGRILETFEDFVVKEFGVGAVKTLHRAWHEFQKTKAPKGQESPFGGPTVASVSRAKRTRKLKAEVPVVGTPPGFQPANFWDGHPILDKAALPLKPPGR